MSDSTLKELWQQVAEKKSCEAKQKELTAQRDTLADRLKKLEKSKLAEQADVDRLEGHRLATLVIFLPVRGKCWKARIWSLRKIPAGRGCCASAVG